MVALSRGSLTTVIDIVVLLLILDHCNGNISGFGCNGDIGRLVSFCGKFVKKPYPQKDPSQVCCQIIKRADVPCVCDHILKGLEDIISGEKVAYTAKFCGNPLQSGSICGDYRVPKA